MKQLNYWKSMLKFMLFYVVFFLIILYFSYSYIQDNLLIFFKYFFFSTDAQLLILILITSILTVTLPSIIWFVFSFWIEQSKKVFKKFFSNSKKVLIYMFKNFHIILLTTIIFIIWMFLLEKIIYLIFPKDIWNLQMFSMLSWTSIILFVLLLVSMAATEEIIFRWFLLTYLTNYIEKKYQNKKNIFIYYWIWIATISLLFTSAHIPQWYSWWTLVSVFIAWCVLWWIYLYFRKYKRKNYLLALSVVIWVHLLNNLINWLLFFYTTSNKVKQIDIYNSNFIVKYLTKKNNNWKLNIQNLFITKYYMPYTMICNNKNINDCNKLKKIIKKDVEKYKENILNNKNINEEIKNEIKMQSNWLLNYLSSNK